MLNDVDPLIYLTDLLTRIVNGHPNRDIDQLLPWAYRGRSEEPGLEDDAYNQRNSSLVLANRNMVTRARR